MQRGSHVEGGASVTGVGNKYLPPDTFAWTFIQGVRDHPDDFDIELRPWTAALTEMPSHCALIWEEMPREAFIHYRDFGVLLHVPAVEIAPLLEGNAHRFEIAGGNCVHESLHVLAVLRLVALHHGAVVPFIAVQQWDRGQSRRFHAGHG